MRATWQRLVKLAQESGRAKMLRAAYEPHRPDEERAALYREGLEQTSRHRVAEAAAGALGGTLLGGIPLSVPFQAAMDRKSRGDFLQALPQLQPSDVDLLMRHGLLPHTLRDMEERARRIGVLAESMVGAPPGLFQDFAREFRPTAQQYADNLRLSPLFHSGGSVSRAAWEAPEGALKEVLRAALARKLMARALPITAAAGVGAYLTQRKYRDLKKTPEEIAADLRKGDVGRYMIQEGVAKGLLPSLALPPVIQSGSNVVDRLAARLRS